MDFFLQPEASTNKSTLFRLSVNDVLLASIV